jgi:large conductance mechanosensitive channel
VVDLAAGIIIIGAAFTRVVNSLIKGIVNPVIGLAIGGVDFSNIFITVNGQNDPTLDAAQKAGAPTVNIGLFAKRNAAEQIGDGKTWRHFAGMP